MNKFHLFCLLLLLLPVVAVARWQDGHDGVDRPGGDLDSSPHVMNNTSQPEDCAALCSQTKNCVAWSFEKTNCNNAGNQAMCWLKGRITSQVLAECRISGVRGAILHPLLYADLPVGAIQPQGWLLRQLETQADGLSGALPHFWSDIQSSSWVGGQSDTGLHERTPYWLNGFVPLAYQLNNDTYRQSVEQYMSYILDHQTDQGWLGADDSKDGNQYWSKFPMLLSLRSYYEATGNSRVIPAMLKFLKEAYKRMFTTPFGVTWSGARWQDLVLSIHWMLDNHPSDQEQFLWDMAELVHNQGFDWKGYFSGPDFPKEPVIDATLFTHGVNVGQAIKSSGVWYRQSHNSSDYKSCFDRIEVLDKYHGQANGMFACDEHLAGTMPSRGTELCTVVEAMYSYEVLFGVFGDAEFAERAEQLAYNALPATITPNMWAHQYLQQVNLMNVEHIPESTTPVWTHDGRDSNIYGLAPNYGCCTANFNQGWPKLTQHTVLSSPDKKQIVIAIYAPVVAKVGGSRIAVNTNYPFNDTVFVDADCASDTTLLFRIPSWSLSTSVMVDGKPAVGSIVPGNLFSVQCTGVHKIKLTFPRTIRIERRYNNSASVYHGPLLYSLHFKENFVVLSNHGYSKENNDYAVHPETPWQYALYLQDDKHPEGDLVFQQIGGDLKNISHLFDPLGVPTKILAKGKKILWQISHDAAAPPPVSPVPPQLIPSDSKLEQIVLLPYGATNLRIGEIPTL